MWITVTQAAVTLLFNLKLTAQLTGDHQKRFASTCFDGFSGSARSQAGMRWA